MFPIERGATRYLDLVKSVLLDELYLENEVRIEYLVGLPPGTAPDPAALRDPPRHLPVRFQRLAQAREAGKSTDIYRNLAYFPYTDMGRARLDQLHRAAAAVVEDEVPGDLVECGVGRGGGAIFLRALLEAYAEPDRQLWVVDPFAASSPAGDEEPDDLAAKVARFRADVNQVRDGFARFDLLDDRVRFLQGELPAALDGAPIDRIALLRLGEGLGPSLGPLLARLLPLVSPGGVVIIEGTDDPAVEATIDSARRELGIAEPLERVDWNAVTWRAVDGARPEVAGVAPRPDGPQGTARRVPLAPSRSADRLALSVVVVFYNMRREAARTLRSLSRSYQRGVEGLDYEVIVIDNGSAPDQRLTEAEVTAYGPEFRFVDLGDDASSSPTVALNRGIALACGEAIALMIDGAHVLTPGVLRLGVTALQTYEPAIVATQQWYLGPGQQGDAQHAGYDQKAEDRLFKQIRWPEDGYRLFEIGHFIGERDWFDGIVESNCLFTPRKLLEQVGGFDDRFAMPGGGYANLDLWERLGATPGVNVASLLGEGTFHQIHGGTTTNVADAEQRRDLVYSYGDHYRELRQRPLVGLTKPVYYLGAMATKAARRTRSRREIDLAFGVQGDPTEAVASETPPPVPDEIKLAAIEAVWEHRAWKEATWLGHPVGRLPTDLFSYQQLLATVRPGWVVVAGDDDALGGRALFLASICDLLDHGRVVAVGRSDAGDRPVHPRVEHVVGAAEDADVAAHVAALVGDPADAVVILGLGAVLQVIGAFEQYAPLVPVGSYVVVENTVVNGRPVAPGYGPGPFEAVVDILGRHRDFVADPAFERYTLTFNRSGFLKRMGES